MSYISITVLIPCYNGAETIERCFDAVLSQNYPKEYLKILCIDDGSIDDSFQIIKSIQEKYPERIKVIQQTNHGIAYTRQKLLENVATPYFIFCDADDYFLDDAINKLVKASNNGGADAVVAKAYRISKRKHRRVWLLNSKLHKKMNTYKYLCNNIPILWNILFKTQSVLNAGFKFKEGLNMSEDMCMLFYTFPKLKHLAICRSKTYCFTQSDNSVSDAKHARYKNILPSIEQLEYFLSISKDVDKKIINEFIFCTFSYIYSMLYILKWWYRWPPPSSDLVNQTYNKLYKLFDEYKIKISSPHAWQRKIFWHFFCKRKILKKYR